MMMPSIFGENLFDSFFDDSFPFFYNDRDLKKAEKKLYGRKGDRMMKTDIRETDDAKAYRLAIDLPGFKKDEISLDLKDGYLTISAEKGLDKDESDKKGKFLRQERYAGSMSRSFYVGDDVESADVSAKFEDGILTVSVPKNAKKQLPKSSSISIQ